MRKGARKFAYLGLYFDLDTWMVQVQDKSVFKLRSKVTAVMERRAWPVFRLRPILDSLVGLLNFMEVVVHALRPYKHWLIGIRRAANRCEVFTLNDTHRGFLEDIVTLALTRNASPIWDRAVELSRLHDHGVATDACEAGFGGWGRTASGEVIYFWGSWSELDDLPTTLIISDLELLAHALAVQFLVPVVAPGARAIDCLIDNQNAQSWVNHLRCVVTDSNPASLFRFRLLRRYGVMCTKLNLAVSTTYINTKKNVWADWLSRPGQVQRFCTDISARQLSARRVLIPREWFKDWIGPEV
jgi:hypothetical protein